MFIKKICLVVFCCLCIVVGGCTTTGSEVRDFSYSLYALDGPDLYVMGQYNGMWIEGSMERKAMLGEGKLLVHEYSNNSAKHVFTCEANFNTQPTEKARVRGVLVCSDNSKIFVTLRNLGPDQGLGVGQPAPVEAAQSTQESLSNADKATLNSQQVQIKPQAIHADRLNRYSKHAGEAPPLGEFIYEVNGKVYTHKSELMVLFFHPSKEEALRRFPEVLRDMREVEIKQLKDKKLAEGK